MGDLVQELRVSLDQRSLERLRRSRVLRRFTIGDVRRDKNQVAFFDTPDRRLRRAGYWLSVRSTGGRFVQTFSCGDAIENDKEAFQVEQSVTDGSPNIDAIPEPELRQRLIDIVDDRPLKKVASSSAWLTTRLLNLPDAGTVKLAIKKGAINSDDRAQDLSEVNLKLVEGNPSAMLRACELLFSDHAFALARNGCDHVRLANILHGALADGSESHKAVRGRPRLDPSMSQAEALRQVGDQAAQQVLRNWVVVQSSTDPEGAHQMRVGLRRFRAAMRAFRPVIPPVRRARLTQDARELARVIGQLRDADVLVDDIYTPVENALGAEQCGGALATILAQHREDQRMSVREALDGVRWSWFKLNLALFNDVVAIGTANGAVPEPGELERNAQRALKRCWKRVVSWGQNIEHLSIDERHEMRKELKALRYTAEFFRDLYEGEEVKRFLKSLKRLQDVFGYLNDVAMTEQLPQIASRFGPVSAVLEREIDLVHDWHQDRADAAWHKAQRRWLALTEEQLFWRR